MFFPCPHCQFLVAHHPQLRPLPAACPRCGKPLQEDGPSDAETAVAGNDAPAPAEAAAPAGDAAPPGTDANDANDTARPSEGNDAIDADPVSGAGEATDAAVAARSAAPATAARPFAAARRRLPWQWPLVALLSLLLALQLLLADRARLAADARWRPLLETACGALGCVLPPWREPSAFAMLDRKVRPAGTPGALRVDATFRNDARWPQPWPALQLALSDADGRTLGSRVFLPEQFLGAAPSTLLAPGQSAQVTFLVREPSPGTVAFAFEFR